MRDVVVAEDFGVYAADGYIGADPRHPLHDVLYLADSQRISVRVLTCAAKRERTKLVAERVAMLDDA